MSKSPFSVVSLYQHVQRHAELFIGRSCRLLRCGGKACPDNPRYKSALSVSSVPLEVYVLKT